MSSPQTTKITHNPFPSRHLNPKNSWHVYPYKRAIMVLENKESPGNLRGFFHGTHKTQVQT
jgi:hypothetical protein